MTRSPLESTRRLQGKSFAIAATRWAGFTRLARRCKGCFGRLPRCRTSGDKPERLPPPCYHNLMSQSDRYLKLTADAKTRIREVTAADLAQTPLDPQTVVIDVREADEWAKGRVVEAIHLPRGIIESRIEEKV